MGKEKSSRGLGKDWSNQKEEVPLGLSPRLGRRKRSSRYSDQVRWGLTERLNRVYQFSNYLENVSYKKLFLWHNLEFSKNSLRGIRRWRNNAGFSSMTHQLKIYLFWGIFFSTFFASIAATLLQRQRLLLFLSIYYEALMWIKPG